MAKKNPPYNEEKVGERVTKAFVTTLKCVMEAKDISMNQLARDSGVSVATISRILSFETQPKFGTLFELYEALGITPQITLHYKEHRMEEVVC